MNTKNLYLSLTVFSSFFSSCSESEMPLSEPKAQGVSFLDAARNSLDVRLENVSGHNTSTTGQSDAYDLQIPSFGSSSSGQPLGTREAFSGLYAIGSVGHSNLSAPRKGSLKLATMPNVGAQTGASISSSHSILSAGLGYGVWINESVLLGIEALGFWDGHDKKSETTLSVGAATLSLTENLTKKFGWEARVKVGRLVNDKLCVYAGAAVEQASFSYTYATNSTLEGKVSRDLWGVSPLAGVRLLLNDQLSLDFTYKYTIYQGMSINNTSANGSQFYRSLKPSNSIAQVGLTYKIN